MKIMLLAIIGLSLMYLFIWIIVRSALKLIESAPTPLPLELQLMEYKYRPSLEGKELMILIELTMMGVETKDDVATYLEEKGLNDEINMETILIYLPLKEK